ncbi:MAG: acetyltransferase [Chloroflexi bacterium]|nr:acetyltransferase [Chloroflexota bacterium]
MQKVVILGAGGQGWETLGILEDINRERGEQWDILGFIDEDPVKHGRVLEGKPVLGDLGWFLTVSKHDVKVICAINEVGARQRIVARALHLGLEFCNVISPYAYISPRAKLGIGITVAAFCVINTNASIGDHVMINVSSTISHDARIGRFSIINPGVHLAGNIRVGEGCYIGMGANVIQGITIGAGSIIGAGAVVIRDVSANVTAVGVPARVIKTRSETVVPK